MIYITCGTCGTSQGYKSSADGALSLPASEETRLVSRGVAEYVTRPILDDEAVKASSLPPSGGSEPSDEPPGGVPSEDPAADEEEEAQGIDEETVEEPGIDEDEEDGDEAAQLARMTKPELEQMARDLGLDTSSAKTKPALITLIMSAEAPEQDNSEDVQ